MNRRLSNQKTHVMVTEPCTRAGSPIGRSPPSSEIQLLSSKSPSFKDTRNQKSRLEKLLKAQENAKRCSTPQHQILNLPAHFVKTFNDRKDEKDDI